MPSRAYRPTLVLVSDGKPNGEWEGPLRRLLTSERAAKAERFAPRHRRGRRPRHATPIPRRPGGTGLRGSRGARDPEVLPVGDHERDLPLAQRRAESNGRCRSSGPRRLRRLLRVAEAVEMFGASVGGPRNVRQGKANQDAWIHAAGAFGHLIGVCDGMGSRRAADAGARAACRALRRAARLWPGGSSPADRPDPTHLVRLVEILWRLELVPRKPSECASTCLFALREPDGHLLFAGLGDGLAIVRGAGGGVATFGGRSPHAFGDETLALGTPHRIDDWWIETEPPGRGRTVVLATDGGCGRPRPRTAGRVHRLAGGRGRPPAPGGTLATPAPGASCLAGTPPPGRQDRRGPRRETGRRLVSRPDTVTSAHGTRYHLGRELGRGGEGAVFAVDGGRLAVKLLRDRSPRSRDRLRDRLAMVGRLPLEGLAVARPLEQLRPPHTGYLMELFTA